MITALNSPKASRGAYLGVMKAPDETLYTSPQAALTSGSLICCHHEPQIIQSSTAG